LLVCTCTSRWEAIALFGWCGRCLPMFKCHRQRPLYGGLTRVNDKCVVGLRWTFFFLTLFSFHILVFRVSRAKNQILLLLLASILIFILVIAICFVFNAFWSFFYFRFHPIYCILFNFFIQFDHHFVDWFFFNPFLDFFLFQFHSQIFYFI
jgi:hypothetical protein